MIRTLTVVACLGLAPAHANPLETDGVGVDQLLSDADFYRLATCGASPGGKCKARPVRWDKSRLTIALTEGETDLPKGFRADLMRALRSAVHEVNAVGAGVSLRYTTGPDADIKVIPTAISEGSVLDDKPGFSGPGVMGVGYMTVWSDERDRIVEAVILISTEIDPSELPSVMLEEVTQSLGFLYDVEGPAYEGVSILSQTANSTLTLTGQDAALLLKHYPPSP